VHDKLIQLILFSGLVYLPLAGGHAAASRGILARDVSGAVMRGTWLTLEPVATAIAFWSLDLRKVADLAAAPVLGSLWMVAMLAPAAATASALRLEQPRRGNFLVAAMFSNNGITLGSFLCLILFGIEGQAVATLFVLGFMPLLLSVGFGIGRRSARAAGLDAGGGESFGLLRAVPYAAMGLGLALNAAGAARPAFTLPLNRAVVFVDVAVYSFAIGTLFDLRSVRRFLRECLAMSGLKFAVSPAIGIVLFLAASLFLHLSPLLLKVMIVQCAMPVAIMSVVVSRFCRLDMQLAAACWVFTTLAVSGIVPVLAYVLPRLVPGD